jgi:hypothetical protein
LIQLKPSDALLLHSIHRCPTERHMIVKGSSRSFVASPDIYKVIAECGDTRVILATWMPGQRDEWHSHPANTVVYALTDCDDLRLYFPDGQYVDGSLKAGYVEIQPVVQSHSFENKTTRECKVLFVERD